ncbi:MAG: energy transducer TonB [Candidatus Sulfotelmatobacter sp.]
MFSQLRPSSSKQRKVLTTSIAMHALFFAWLLHAPDPRLINPNSIANGHNGRVVSKLYFPTLSPDDSSTSSSDQARQRYHRRRLGHEKLILNKTLALAQRPAPPSPFAPSGAEDDAKTATLSKLGHGAPAGSPYGSVPGGKIYGDEVIPALPIATADPVVYPWQRPTSEGRVVIEITIDETGAIIRKTVLQSLGPEIDDKCLAALESWRFRPAMQNGSPIPSKQDAIFPFKARG